MSENKKILAHLEAAKAYAKLSKCKRLKVGAVIVRDDRIISVGYNGCVSGGSNECEENDKTKPEVIHAEMNAIAFAARHGTSTDNCVLVTTHAPCFECSRLILQSGIKQVYYDEEFRDLSGVYFLADYILVKEIT